MDETRAFYVLLTAITIKENGGLKILISGLDNRPLRLSLIAIAFLIVESTNETINTPKVNFTDTEIDMSRCDLCCRRLPLLPPFTAASCEYLRCQHLTLFCATFLLPTLQTSLSSSSSYCRRLLFLRHLLPSSLTAAIIYHCFVRLFLCQRYQLLSSSSSPCRRLLFLRHLLPSSTTVASQLCACCQRSSHRLLCRDSCDISTIVSHCCHHQRFVPTAVIVFFYCCRLLFLRHLLPSSPHCGHHLPLLCATSAANVTNCCHRLLLLQKQTNKQINILLL
ncbi:hypothetical protein CEXT_338361 [Caerostris extrusa]|uniref:Uncharacterized protein n=1 Tax=Caerostris extrusa TaxID=172846 RepID=A0AAV4XYE6_CAEEX|nr:hypothetical protein CEXT_338361 [Caerostris extrusa]